MNTIMKEYGHSIMMIAIGVIVNVLVFGLLLTSMDKLYPQYNQRQIPNYAATYSGGTPVLTVKTNIPLNKGDDNYNIKKYAKGTSQYNTVLNRYKSFATAKESDSNNTALSQNNIKIFGIDNVDITKRGVYNVLYVVTNSHNKTFSKTVMLIVN